MPVVTLRNSVQFSFHDFLARNAGKESFRKRLDTSGGERVRLHSDFCVEQS